MNSSWNLYNLQLQYFKNSLYYKFHSYSSIWMASPQRRTQEQEEEKNLSLPPDNTQFHTSLNARVLSLAHSKWESTLDHIVISRLNYTEFTASSPLLTTTILSNDFILWTDEQWTIFTSCKTTVQNPFSRATPLL